MKIAREIGNRGEEVGAYGNLGNTYHSLGDYRRAIEYHEKSLKIAREIGYRGGQVRAYGNLGNTYHSLSDYRKAIEYHEKSLKIAIEIGDRDGEGSSYHNIGKVYSSLEQFENAVANFVSALNSLRSLLKSQDSWKIKYRERLETAYTALWKSFLVIGKVDEALFAAEQGRAQTLSDNLLIQLKLSASSSPTIFDTEGPMSRLFTKVITTNYLSRN